MLELEPGAMIIGYTVYAYISNECYHIGLNSQRLCLRARTVLLLAYRVITLVIVSVSIVIEIKNKSVVTGITKPRPPDSHPSSSSSSLPVCLQPRDGVQLFPSRRRCPWTCWRRAACASGPSWRNAPPPARWSTCSTTPPSPQGR